MTEATPEMREMARRIALSFYPETHPGFIGAEHCTLAAIIEATEKCAETVEAEMPMIQCMSVEPVVGALQRAAAAIRTGKQYGK